MLYLPTDEGDCFSYNDGSGLKIYEKVGPDVAVINGDATNIVDPSISGFTFGYNTDAQGKTIYTAGEWGVAFELPQHQFNVVVPANDTDWYTLIPSVTVEGVLRVYINSPESYSPFFDFQLAVNELSMFGPTALYSLDTHSWAIAVNVGLGDVVEVRSTSASNNGATVRAGLLPFDWP